MRYYSVYAHAEHEDEADTNVTISGWHIFDRQIVNKYGVVKAIARCINRNQAFKIRDALNKSEVK